MHRDTGPPSVGVQRRDAFIRVPKGPRTTRLTDIKSQKARGRPDGRTDILYWYSGDLNPWPAAACTVRNYEPREWTFIDDLKPFFKPKFQYNLFIYFSLFYSRLWKKSFLKIITSVNVNSTGRTNDRQKATQTTPRTDGHISSTGPHWGPSVPILGGGYDYDLIYFFRTPIRCRVLVPRLVRGQQVFFMRAVNNVLKNKKKMAKLPI